VLCEKPFAMTSQAGETERSPACDARKHIRPPPEWPGGEAGLTVVAGFDK